MPAIIGASCYENVSSWTYQEAGEKSNIVEIVSDNVEYCRIVSNVKLVKYTPVG